MSHRALGLAALALDVLELAAHGRQLLFGATRLGASRIGLAAQLGQLLRQAQVFACAARSSAAAARASALAGSLSAARSCARSSSRRRARASTPSSSSTAAAPKVTLPFGHTTHPPRVTKRTPSAPRACAANAASTSSHTATSPSSASTAAASSSAYASSSTSARPRP
ncbi:MAG: hypothetical protein ACLU7P_15955, partial [Eggerthella lenta]